jgi:TfoX/Sxy family transcriptional regulator of competence genes
VAAMYSWQHYARGTVSCKQSRHSVIMEEWKGRQRAFAIKMFYKTDDSLEAAQREFRRIFQLGRHGRVLF